MKQYIEISIRCADEEMADIITAYLADYPFESFDTEISDNALTLKAYILATAWVVCRQEALSSIADFGEVIGEQEIEDENWNAAWEEEGFQPVDVDGKILIRAPHHTPPSEDVIDIIVSPQMSFGSGHHQTTRMMCRLIANRKNQGDILDVGCGTGVLSIAALKCGAKSADAIDIDPWSTESAKEAAELNNLSAQMNIILGTVEAIEGKCYDMVVANINRNIILGDIERYDNAMKSGGTLLLSGFLHQDIEDITTAATERGLSLAETVEEDDWVALAFTK
ncbi:MAG: 50S ribosomal protein L11 methyltransferase [Alistipes sp.]|nr:50S ribosomal protein L11 methyltransferase [Alistipes sp.]